MNEKCGSQQLPINLQKTTNVYKKFIKIIKGISTQILNKIDMKDKKSKKRLEFNIHLNQEDRDVINELMGNGINVSKSFKIFIRQHLDKIKKINENN